MLPTSTLILYYHIAGNFCEVKFLFFLFYQFARTILLICVRKIQNLLCMLSMHVFRTKNLTHKILLTGSRGTFNRTKITSYVVCTPIMSSWCCLFNNSFILLSLESWVFSWIIIQSCASHQSCKCCVLNCFLVNNYAYISSIEQF